MQTKLSGFILLCACLLLNEKAFAAYCGSQPSCGNASINSVTINATSSANAGGAGSFTVFTSPTYSMSPLQTCNLTITGDIGFAGNYHLNAWIDWDGSGDWNGVTSEIIPFTTVSYALGAFTQSTSFTVPALATTGNSRLRVQLRYVGPVFGAPNPCQNNFCGEVEDYPVSIIPLPPICSSASGNSSGIYISRTDVNGTTTFSGPSTSSSFLPGITLFPQTNYTLSVDVTNPTAIAQSVYVYGWLEVNGDHVFSANANEQIVLTPSAVNIPAFSTQSFSKVFHYSPPYATQASTLRITASQSSFGIPDPCATSFTGEVEDYSVVMHTDYCTDTASYNFDYITDVTMNGVSTPSGPSYYSDFTNVVIPVFPGQTYPVSVTTAGPPTIASVYVDFNQNGYFQDPGEQINLTPGGGTFTGNIPVPANATVGNTRMRVVSIYTVGGGNALPCYLNGVSGEVEDYTVMIISPNPPAISCVSDITVSQEPGLCHKQVIYALPVCTSNCNGGSIAMVSGLASGSNFPVGTTPVTYSVTTPGGKASCTFFVTVNLNPLPVFTPAGTINICQGDVANLSISTSPTYLWNTGETTQSIAASTSGNYVVTVSDNSGCTQSFSQTVIVNPLPAAFTGNSDSICIGSGIFIGSAAISGNSYNWSPSAGLSSSTVASPFANPLSTTTYTLTETISGTGCTNSNSISITVNAVPDAITGADQSLCAGNNVSLGAASVGGNSYNWSPAAGLSSATVSNPTASPASTTVYTLIETIDATGCSKSSSVTVTVNPMPAAITGPDQSNCFGSTVDLGIAAIPGNIYNWSPSTGLSSATVSNPTANPVTTTIYTLTESTTAGCMMSNVVSVTVSVTPDILLTLNVQSTTALAAWNSVGPGVSYFVAKRKIGNLNFDPGWVTTDTSWQFVNMTPGTDYVWHVRTVCSPGNHSNWSPIVPFTTTSNICTNIPTGLIAVNKTTSGVKLKWDTLSPQPDKYQLRYQIKGASSWTYLTGAGNLTSRVLSGLTAGAKYEWQIRGRCGLSAPYDYSPWSVVAAFKLPLVRLAEDANQLSCNVYPNPTTGIVTLTVSDCENCKYNLVLHDAIGRTVFTQDVTFERNSIQLDFSNLEKGIYALSINNDGEKKVIKILIH